MLNFLPKNTGVWLPEYIKQIVLHKLASKKNGECRHIIFCFADHYEPGWGKPGVSIERDRVNYWIDNYPKMAKNFVDSEGFHPKHSFFFPEEEYRAEHIESLAGLCEKGFGEVEIHLHHDDDTEAGLREKLTSFIKILREEHGLLGDSLVEKRPAYGFIHGNWSLNNSRKDRAWCGVNNESEILLETGCFADFTMPSAPSDTQTKTINSIYYSDPFKGEPKCHNTGKTLNVASPRMDKLLLVQGPLMLNWTNRSRKILPRIESSDVDADCPATKDRIKLWDQANIHVEGRPEWIFIKVHTHGAIEENAQSLLGQDGMRMHQAMQEMFNSTKDWKLHYVSAREMVNIIRAAEAGKTGNPGKYRDYEISVPPRLSR